MKKVTKVVTLAAAAMCAFGLVGVAGAAIAKDFKAPKAAEVEYYQIKVLADSKVTVDVKALAKEGEKIEVALTYNRRSLAVDSILVGENEYAVKLDDNHYYFAMPASDTVIKVNSRSVRGDESILAIDNGSAEEGMFFDGCPATARAGDLISFTVSMAADSPFRFVNEIEIEDASEVSVSHSELNGVYSFVMPDSAVTIYGRTEARLFEMTFDNNELVSKVTFTDNYSYFTQQDKVTYAGEDGIYYIPYGADVTVTLTDTYVYLVDGIKLGDQEVMFDGTKVISFEMPGKNIAFEVKYSTFYRPVGVFDPSLFEAVTCNDHYTWEFRRSKTANNDDYEIFNPEEAVYGDYVRAYYTIKEEYSNKAPYSLQVFGVTNEGKVYIVTPTKSSDAFGNYIQFSITSSYIMYFVNVESELTNLTGYEFVGTFKSYNVYNYSIKTKVGSGNMSNTATIAEGGTFKHPQSSTLMAIELTENTKKEGDCSFNYVYSGYSMEIPYVNGFIIYDYDPTYSAYEQGTDLYVGYKVASGTPSIQFIFYPGQYLAAQVKMSGAVVANLFCTFINGTSGYISYPLNEVYSTGVEFNFTAQTAVNAGSSTSPTAIFDVVVDGVTIGTVNKGVYTPVAA